MDRKYGPQWHCAIGAGFGFDVTYQQPNAFAYYGKIGILLFRARRRHAAASSFFLVGHCRPRLRVGRRVDAGDAAGGAAPVSGGAPSRREAGLLCGYFA